MEPPFKVGDRVRMKSSARARHPNYTSFVGTVQRVKRFGYTDYFIWEVGIKRDGLSPKSDVQRRKFISSTPDDFEWELVPFLDLSLDEVAVQLARAVLAGDTVAAGPLADRVSELISEYGRQ